MEDVVKAYPVDAERTYITGYSMGGYMTYRLGLLMPDRYAPFEIELVPVNDVQHHADMRFTAMPARITSASSSTGPGPLPPPRLG